ncbi:MAG: FUSC family membrane protein [Cyclobacteriaceae bacterium]
MKYYDSQHIKSYLFGQYLRHGIKLTIGIIMPSLFFVWADNLYAGLIISLGAFYVSIADHPGPVTHRKNGMLVANIFIFFTAVVSGFLNHYYWLLIIEIPLFCFLFGMLMVYGVRASATGTAALLMMVSSIYFKDNSIHFIEYALLSLAGGIWYMVLSLSLNQIRPYRQAQQDLGECILEIGDYLRLKAQFFDTKTSIESLYQKLVVKQIKVNDHQDNVRQNVFRTRRKVSETMKSGRLVLMIFIDIVELFEQAMSIQHNYKRLRYKYGEYQILPIFRDLINKLAIEIDDLGYALINNEKPKKLLSFDNDLENIKKELDDLEAQGVSVLTLKKILIKIRNMTRLLAHIYNYFQAEQLTFLSKTEEADLTKFVSRQDFDWKIIINNLSFRSVAFRHSIRLSIGCFLAFLISLWLPNNEHSHWVLLTVLVILKPDFGLTRRRNYERIIGTLSGGLIGAMILFLIENETAKLIILTVFMIMAFSFNRTRYAISVLFMTALILILLSFVNETSNLYNTSERILFTIIGSAIAFSASYFILPTWESSQIKPYLSASLKANLNYLQQMTTRLSGSFSEVSFKLARKELYMQTAHLSAAHQRMLNEPKRKQIQATFINEFAVLSHILASYLASLSYSLVDLETQSSIDVSHLKLIRKAKYHLEQAINNIDKNSLPIEFDLPDITRQTHEKNSDILFIEKQLILIEKVSADIEKLSEKLSELPDNK